MKLSVMVISHNQAHLIRRCLDSILAQKITAPWEIVISDDASTDDTWDVIQEYVKQYSESKKKGEMYVPKIKAYQINSSDYNPTVTSDRCAANKANVYMHAEGEYCVNMDADDYLKSDDIYAYQISQLESHPECSVAVQNIWYLKDGDAIEQGYPWHYNGAWRENEVISFEEYCKRRLFTSNPAFMMRRDAELKPMEKYGLFFDDPIISAHHILRGKIICSERADYVYVQYPRSIWNKISEGDRIVREITPTIVYLKFFLQYKKAILDMEAMELIRSIKSYLNLQDNSCSKETLAYVRRLQSKILLQMAEGDNKCRMQLKILLNTILVRNAIQKDTVSKITDKMILKLLK
ncbi:MAG: glycosyltransferase family 2 protein [Paludibacteraceae bacterium]|nr:glycosyltransferase family 2 protein [Paludibacteraceae bacterium]